ncbi:MAG: putative bifunctional diguanylate cyclase/phosphodiesterase, partial [Carboxydocellales bacterium]
SASSQDLALRIQETVRENPDLWQFSVAKLAHTFSDYHSNEQDLICSIIIYDQQQKVIHQETQANHSFQNISGRAKIMYNNQVYGYVVVSKSIDGLIYSTLCSLMVFSLLGLLVGTVLFRFPAGIVKRAEDKTLLAFQKLNYLSYHDPLTNLPNRTQFNEQLTQALSRACRDGSAVAVMFLDLDRFKLINDTLGHSIGDFLLKKVAKRLTRCVRMGDIVSRLGGDEFTVILPGVTSIQDAAKVAQKIIETLEKPFKLESHELFITTSIGISMYPIDGSDMETLVKNADTAMYLAKEHGRNKYKFYTVAMNEAALEKLNLENKLRKAIHRQEMAVHYQPIFDLKTKEIKGVEALVRWQHPELGLIEPDKFYALAEETGLTLPLGEWVLRTACAQNKAWQQAGLPPIYMSVNLSARQFQQQNLIDNIIMILNETGLEYRYLQLEITENIAMFNEDWVIAKFRTLKNLGISIAIDDFGTGYSSLSCLKKYPIHKLKIDKVFIQNITVDAFDTAIATSIINMAHSLGLNVVAEGVETEAQLAFLRDGWCNEAQGYLFCSPLPAGELEEFLDKQKLIHPSGALVEGEVAYH